MDIIHKCIQYPYISIHRLALVRTDTLRGHDAMASESGRAHLRHRSYFDTAHAEQCGQRETMYSYCCPRLLKVLGEAKPFDIGVLGFGK